MEFEEVRKQAESCMKCDLWKTRTNVVFGEGPANAEIMLIGEAPGFYEDKQGKPFVGRAGKFLDELLKAANLRREEVYITNIVKCRPPNNRDPTDEEVKACYPYLDFQINYIKPKVIITLGRHASRVIFERYNLTFEGISKEHGKPREVSNLFGKLKIIPMYHPAAAIYNQSLKSVLIEDFKKALKNV
ncbi:MAG: uracil-DNA glycosylase [Nanoarchaeota archaeon]|nr:uracil-DNA glycosylase [Nanoarchaeota archaeon]